MKHKLKKTGFTIVEVALFLALSGFLMIGIIVGANTSISRQRYNDAVNGFAEYVRGVYTDVLNVSNDKSLDEEAGRTKTAVYGKLISIGECADASCSTTTDTIYTYDIVGLAVSSSAVKGTRAIDMLYNTVNNGGVNANIFDREGCNGTTCQAKPYRMTTYQIPWEGSIGQSNTTGQRFHGAILVVRSPSTGSIRTYTYVYPSNKLSSYSFHLKTQIENTNDPSNTKSFAYFMKTVGHQSNNYGENELTICVDSEDNNYPNRRGIMIAARANNSASIMVTEMDAEDSLCKGRNYNY
ncbi:hypothetical protein IK146_01440 [Candidatus Saccharibacteria bacterium]|nr:hypothetical protein [Candidatus Saccharibacteria bacterium]